MKSLNCLPTQEKNAMARTVRQSVCNELRDKYEDVDLEEVFTREYGNECKRVPLAWWEIKRKIRRIVLSKEDKYLINGKKAYFPLEECVYPEYHKEIDVSLNRFIDDCLRFGILKEASRGKYEMVEADPIVFDSESNGVCLTCKWKESFTVYQKRMNASGKIDVKANGDPAIEGIASQDPLAH